MDMKTLEAYASKRLEIIKNNLKNKKTTTCELKARTKEVKNLIENFRLNPALYFELGYITEFLKNRKSYLMRQTDYE